MKFAQYVRSVDSESVGIIIRSSTRAKPTIVTVLWLVSGVRADSYKYQLRVICPTCAKVDGDFSLAQLERARAECEECGP